jgi:hypothetical protein
MTKPNQVPTSPPGNAPNHLSTSPQNAPAAPSWLVEEPDGPLGVSFDPADQLRRYLKLPQANTPEAISRDAGNIAGVVPGCWLFYPEQFVVDGVEGFYALLCGLRRLHIEYAPLRGGLVQVHETAPADLVEVYDETKKRPTFVRSATRNPVEDTRELFLLAELPHYGWMPYSFYCTSTFVQPLQAIISKLFLYRHPVSGNSLPSFSRRVRMTTVRDSNQWGNWFKPRFTDETWATREEYDKAKAFAAEIKRNKSL